MTKNIINNVLDAFTRMGLINQHLDFQRIFQGGRDLSNSGFQRYGDQAMIHIHMVKKGFQHHLCVSHHRWFTWSIKMGNMQCEQTHMFGMLTVISGAPQSH